MSTAKAYGTPVYTGQNGSNGLGVAARANYVASAVASTPIGTATYITQAINPISATSTRTGVNGSNGLVVAGVANNATNFVASAPVSAAFPPSANPGA